MAVALIVEPGVAAPVGTAAPKALGDPVPLYDQLVGIVPLNIVDALAKGDMLALIFVAILVGSGTRELASAVTDTDRHKLTSIPACRISITYAPPHPNT